MAVSSQEVHTTLTSGQQNELARIRAENLRLEGEYLVSKMAQQETLGERLSEVFLRNQTLEDEICSIERQNDTLREEARKPSIHEERQPSKLEIDIAALSRELEALGREIAQTDAEITKEQASFNATRLNFESESNISFEKAKMGFIGRWERIAQLMSGPSAEIAGKCNKLAETETVLKDIALNVAQLKFVDEEYQEKHRFAEKNMSKRKARFIALESRNEQLKELVRSSMAQFAAQHTVIQAFRKYIETANERALQMPPKAGSASQTEIAASQLLRLAWHARNAISMHADLVELRIDAILRQIQDISHEDIVSQMGMKCDILSKCASEYKFEASLAIDTMEDRILGILGCTPVLSGEKPLNYNKQALNASISESPESSVENNNNEQTLLRNIPSKRLAGDNARSYEPLYSFDTEEPLNEVPLANAPAEFLKERIKESNQLSSHHR